MREESPSRSKVDHSTAGAQHAVRTLNGMREARLLAYAIAGHHGGLPDWESPDGRGCLRARLDKSIPSFESNAPSTVLAADAPTPPALKLDRGHIAFQVSFFCRMLYSCLVDADFLSTESFFRPGHTVARSKAKPDTQQMYDVLIEHIRSLANDTQIGRIRDQILDACLAASALSPGLFSLTVPTGGGKTLSAMAFALRHAHRHGLNRVICAIPFTSIIEQNADCYRRIFSAFADDVVLEHHSNFDPAQETLWSRLATENWDAPIVVTTNVQFYESLLAASPSHCRKLHNIAGSVILLDEVQAIPVEVLKPCLAILNELAVNYGCSIVLCSATQPAITARDDFSIGLEGVREIIPDPQHLYREMKRTNIKWIGELDNEELSKRLIGEPQVLCIVNTRRDTANLYQLLSETGGVSHLSAAMCPEHRTQVLNGVRKRLDQGLPCRVVSTQLIEAGVDIDFPVVYRALAGIDSIAQAAGRCNREGRKKTADVYVFQPSNIPPGHLRQTADTTKELLDRHDDLLSLEAIEEYFQLHYFKRQTEWDHEEIMGLFKHPMVYQFRQAAERFHLIKDETRPVIVPWGEKGQSVAKQLTDRFPPTIAVARRAQRFTVSVRPRLMDKLTASQAVKVFHDRYPILQDMNCYDENLGLIEPSNGYQTESLVF